MNHSNGGTLLYPTTGTDAAMVAIGGLGPLPLTNEPLHTLSVGADMRTAISTMTAMAKYLGTSGSFSPFPHIRHEIFMYMLDINPQLSSMTSRHELMVDFHLREHITRQMIKWVPTSDTEDCVREIRLNDKEHIIVDSIAQGAKYYSALQDRFSPSNRLFNSRLGMLEQCTRLHFENLDGVQRFSNLIDQLFRHVHRVDRGEVGNRTTLLFNMSTNRCSLFANVKEVVFSRTVLQGMLHFTEQNDEYKTAVRACTAFLQLHLSPKRVCFERAICLFETEEDEVDKLVDGLTLCWKLDELNYHNVDTFFSPSSQPYQRIFLSKDYEAEEGDDPDELEIIQTGSQTRTRDGVKVDILNIKGPLKVVRKRTPSELSKVQGTEGAKDLLDVTGDLFGSPNPFELLAVRYEPFVGKTGLCCSVCGRRY